MKKFANLKYIKKNNIFNYKRSCTTLSQGWKYKIKDGALVCEMNSNRVNSMGSRFLEDMNNFLDIREKPEYRELPVVLIASGTTYSAGLDVFELFDREKEDSKKFVRKHLTDLGNTLIKFWQLPVPTITACNGNAIAGGAILLLCGDYRIGVRKKYVVGVNELNVGVPFPLWAFEIVNYSLNQENTRIACLTGDLYSPDVALKMGFFNELSEPELMLSVALERAKRYPVHNLGAFSRAKSLLFLDANSRLNTESERVMDEVIEYMYSQKGWDYLQHYIHVLKNKRHHH